MVLEHSEGVALAEWSYLRWPWSIQVRPLGQQGGGRWYFCSALESREGWGSWHWHCPMSVVLNSHRAREVYPIDR